MSVTAVVDFGSSHTVTVVHVPGSAPRVVSVDGEPWLSSAVFLSRDDALVVGADALRMGVADPSRLASRPKARLAEREILLGDTVVPVATMVRAVLAKAVRAAAAVAGAPVDHLVLTHPADWSAERLGGLLTAATGLAAGVSTIAEPVGAGVWFATRGEVGVDGADRLPLGAVLGVLDVGGGTVDVAVVRRERTGIVVVGHASIPDLGGDDLDQRLADHLRATVPGLAERLADPPESDLVRLREAVAFRREVRRAKELLSRHDRVEPRLPGGLPPAVLTRADLDRVLHRDLDRITAFTLLAILRAGVEAHELTALQLAGGSTRIPLLRRLLAEVVPAPVRLDDQPESVVALGACAVAVSHSAPPAVASASAPVAPRSSRLVGLVLVVLLAVAAIGYSLLRPADAVAGGGLATNERFTLPAPAAGAPLVRVGTATDGLVTGRVGVPVRMFDGVTDVDWTVRGFRDPAADELVALTPSGVRWVIVDASIRARAAVSAPYYLGDTYLLDDRGLLIRPERGVPMPSSCPTETPRALAEGQDARQCLAFSVSARTPVRAVVISKVSDGAQVGVVVPVRGAEPAAGSTQARPLPPGVVRPLLVGGVPVRAAVIDVVTSPGAYAGPGIVDRPGSRAVVVRAVADAPRAVPVMALAARLVLRDDRSQPVPVRFVSPGEGCAAGTAKGRVTVCAVFVVPARMPLGSVTWSGDDARSFVWRLR
ncbi:Hsp70 family protein [Actinophytocola glycyrrhizae]|uniref:Hsp70 family protein n=1 Tax=Actinophytocola glycyrrhizae TaxID=2044873 RepID=A0ABV9S9I1_9PSEU